MAKVWGYDIHLNNFRLFSNERDWRDQMTFSGAERYLTDHLRAQLTREIPPAIRAYERFFQETRIGTGFWTLLRTTFSAITFLGTLYQGKDSTANSVSFIKDYLGKSKPRYSDIFLLLFTQYRHGLIHTAMPKVFQRDDGFVVGWHVTSDPTKHLTTDREPGGKGPDELYPVLCPEALYMDVVAALDLYAADFRDPKKQKERLHNFNDGFLTMATVFRSSELPKTPPEAKKAVEECMHKL